MKLNHTTVIENCLFLWKWPSFSELIENNRLYHLLVINTMVSW